VPETSSEYDGGFTKTFGELASFSATYFARRIHHVIFNDVPCDMTADPVGCAFGIKPDNAERLDVQGVELEPWINITRDFRFGGNFTAIDSTHHSVAASIRPTRAPKHSAAGLLQYSHPALFRDADRISAAFVYTFFGDRDDFDPVQGTIRSHVGYHRFDAVLGYSPGLRGPLIRNEQVYVRVQNLMDRNYAEAFGFKSPPINAVAGVKLEF
jgi:hypothetical protein